MLNVDIKPVAGPQVWRGPELAARDDWIHPVPQPVIDDLDALIAEVRAQGHTQESFDFEATDIASLHAYVAPIREALANGYGLAMVRGLPVERYDTEELKVALLVIGHHLGLVGPQAGRAKCIGEVMDVDTQGEKKLYYYHSGGPLPMHMDPIDVVGLLCLRMAKRGGESCIVSSMAVHNEVLRSRPDLLEQLYHGFPNARRGDRRPDGRIAVTDYRCPVFADIGGEIVCSYLPASIFLAVDDGSLTLSPREHEALDFMARTTSRPDLVLPMHIEPGDIQLLNNRRILHARADYEDYPELDRRRLLLRLWLTMPGWRKYPAHFPHFDVEMETSVA